VASIMNDRKSQYPLNTDRLDNRYSSFDSYRIFLNLCTECEVPTYYHVQLLHFFLVLDSKVRIEIV